MADKPVHEVVAADAALDALTDPSSSDVYEALLPFDPEAGVAVAASRALAGGGGGGGDPAPITRAVYASDLPVEIAGNYSTHNMPWDTLLSGTALLDLNNPLAPTVVTAGVYAITANVRSETALTAGKAYRVTMEMDYQNDDAEVLATGGDGGGDRSLVSVTGVYYFPAGGELHVWVSNGDTESREFSILNANVQRIS